MNYRIEDNKLFFYGSPYSQWFTAPNLFVEDGIVYTSTEKYMMVKKAELMGDYGSYVEMVDLDEPSKLKALGRRVANWDEQLWNENKEEIVTRANFLKFYCNKELREMILEHQDLMIVEASPTDTIWGIGLAVSDDDVLDESKWQGENLLGKCIMTARDIILTMDNKYEI